jgi:hypothetical protein
MVAKVGHAAGISIHIFCGFNKSDSTESDEQRPTEGASVPEKRLFTIGYHAYRLSEMWPNDACQSWIESGDSQKSN